MRRRHGILTNKKVTRRLVFINGKKSELIRIHHPGGMVLRWGGDTEEWLNAEITVVGGDRPGSVVFPAGLAMEGDKAEHCWR